MLSRNCEVEAVQCPQCASAHVVLDGQRFLGSGEAIQRFLCKVCGLRFSEEHKVLNKIKTNGKRRVCDLIEESKNLAEPQIKGLAGVTDADLKGLLTIYMAKAEHQGHAETTIHRNIQNLTWLAAHANLDNPVEVWVAIENQKQWKNGTKQITASAYKHFRKTFNKPIPQDLNFTKWVMSERIPYVPTERELLDLIANSNYRIAPFLRLLFETGMRSGEAWALKWTDFDLEKKIVTLNAENVEKHGKPRQFKLSDQLIAMLNRLPKKTQTVWCGIKSLKVLRSSFSQQRRRLAYKLQNLKLTKITLHTFRHFYATKLYHSTKDILLVKERLGHRNIQSTMVYTSLVEWDEPDKWTVRRPSTTKEEDELLEAGFEYVRFDDKLNVPIYRKRK